MTPTQQESDKKQKLETGVHQSTDLARDRNREATDRTLMAWIRTSLSLIGFGFGASKAIEYLEKVHPDLGIDLIRTVSLFGGAFIGLGSLGLLAALIQHRVILRRIQSPVYVYQAPWPIAEIMAGLLLLVGLIALVDFFL
ncbi:hypothetical protein D3OALGA1CA_1736 [Olavius algarvensis associated proteobacterium Delta 3]|nr:hypothetical protein D3OALGB2SA_1162 [Olavius algarvensis associated proteobacterium Delta 3]CAB5106103.1 hypothetical protein D3OALGA1CA_1736 [Olavius algarvensis associated proteobacterium Delta 3]